MPRVKNVKSLSEICRDFILVNQDNYCNKASTELENNVNILDSEKPTTNPFDELPSVLLEELVNLIRKKCVDSPPYKFQINPIHKLLMTHNLRTLDLTKSKKDNDDISDVLCLAAIRSPHLEILRLGYCMNYQYPKFLNFVPKFSKLQVLDISSSVSGNDCMKILGTHCADLRELHAKRSQVSDDGIRELCVIGGCKSIRVLDLSGCQVTTKGIQVALDNLPELNVLCHESLLDGLAEIAQSAIDRELKFPKYSLTTLYVLVEETVYKSGTLKQSLLLCPNVTKVHFWLKMEGFKDVDLLSLLSLKTLRVLIIRYCPRIKVTEREELGIFGRNLTFEGGVFPLLKKFGNSITILSLEGSFLNVNIPGIIELCPNVQTLSFWCEHYQTPSSIEHARNTLNNMKQPVLKKLEKLYISSWYSDDNDIPSEYLLVLLSSASLGFVNIKGCRILTDEILQRAADLHSFRNLEYLSIYFCHSVTKKGVDVFMQEKNPLKHICLLSCRGITGEDYMDWREKSIWIRRNWQFTFITNYFSYRDGVYHNE